MLTIILHNSFSECAPPGLCSTVQQTPSSSEQTACRETASLGNAHTQQQTALKNRKHRLFITQQRTKTAFGFFIFWVTMAERIWFISKKQQSSLLTDVLPVSYRYFRGAGDICSATHRWHKHICCGQEGPAEWRRHQDTGGSEQAEAAGEASAHPVRIRLHKHKPSQRTRMRFSELWQHNMAFVFKRSAAEMLKI